MNSGQWILSEQIFHESENQTKTKPTKQNNQTEKPLSMQTPVQLQSFLVSSLIFKIKYFKIN